MEEGAVMLTRSLMSLITSLTVLAGTTLSAAPTKPQTPSTNAIESIAFMITSEI